MSLNKQEKQLVQIERACGDLRRGMPIVITQENGNYIIAASPDNISFISNLFIEAIHKKIIISSARAGYLFPDEKITTSVSIKADSLSLEEIASICSSSPSPIKLQYSDLEKATEIEQSALNLAKISELIPAIIIIQSTEKISEDFLSVPASSINSYMENMHYSLSEACRAPLTLAHAPNAEIIAYRPNVGGSEHYAIIIGKNKFSTPSISNNPLGAQGEESKTYLSVREHSEPMRDNAVDSKWNGCEPLIRVHSSCYTGDLLASLDCDCRDQLQSAIELMEKNNGGIILYLMQEGRGIGLVNKLRAYDLKHKGMDTVEANQALGFDDDERLFLPAAEILKKLGIGAVRLLTNNPRKAAGLEEHGIKVTECVPHIMQSNEHNKAYLQTKADRLGHKI